MRQPDAAVAILRTPAPTESILLMRRAERADDPWSGHWSFPGGRREPEDPDLTHTALRELEEECGIVLRGEQLQRALPPVVARRRTGPFLLVAPFVFHVERELPTVLDFREAVQGTWVSRSILTNPANHRLSVVPNMPDSMLFPVVDLAGMPLWGFTYRLITEWLQLVPDGASAAEMGFHEAERLLSVLVSDGLRLKEKWTGTQPRVALVEGIIPAAKLIAHLSAPNGRIPLVNVVEIRPDQIRVAGLGFEEYLIRSVE